MKKFDPEKFCDWVEENSINGKWIQTFDTMGEAYTYGKRLREMIGLPAVAAVEISATRVIVTLLRTKVNH